MKVVIALLGLMLAGCQNNEPQTETGRPWPQSPREAFAGMEDTSCKCLQDEAKCRNLEVENTWTWEARSFVCSPLPDQSNKALCRYVGRDVIDTTPKTKSPWMSGGAVVTKIAGRGWCFHEEDEARNQKTGNEASWAFTTLL